MMMTKTSRRSRAMIAMAAVLIFAGSAAEARMGGRGSFGSRGARTWSAPPSTNTAPGAAAPIQRSQVPNQGINRPATAGAPAAAQPGRFGLGTGLMAGLFGAGLLGMLMGNGFFGGLAGLASVFGLLLQIGLVVLLVSFAMKWFRNRQQQPAYARTQSHPRSRAEEPIRPAGHSALGGLGSSGTGGLGAGLRGGLAGLGGALGGARAQGSSARPGVRDEVGIADDDFVAFEKALVDMQAAYSRGDVETIWPMSTPEMAGYIQEELNDFAARGEVNQVSDVKLLQGDLAEAWREGETEYATVAMRYALKDVTTEKATGQIIEGDPNETVEARELWTFRRDRKGPWVLSAIQQA